MSKTLVLEIPDDVYSSVQKQAESKGSTTENVVLEVVLKNFSKSNGNLSGQEKSDALKELMKFAGAVNGGNPRSADNEQIDADLAAEYGKDL